MTERTDGLKTGYMPNGTLYAANRSLVRTWHRRKEKVKAKKLAALEHNTLNAIS